VGHHPHCGRRGRAAPCFLRGACLEGCHGRRRDCRPHKGLLTSLLRCSALLLYLVRPPRGAGSGARAQIRNFAAHRTLPPRRSTAHSLARPLTTRQRNVSFKAPWGANSWLVDYTGPFSNDRPPHVEVGAANMKAHKAGEFHCLANLHVSGSQALEWDVPGVTDSLTKSGAHFTCYYGPGAASKLPEYE
jgi:hypothetical protein